MDYCFGYLKKKHYPKNETLAIFSGSNHGAPGLWADLTLLLQNVRFEGSVLPVPSWKTGMCHQSDPVIISDLFIRKLIAIWKLKGDLPAFPVFDGLYVCFGREWLFKGLAMTNDHWSLGNVSFIEH